MGALICTMAVLKLPRVYLSLYSVYFGCTHRYFNLVTIKCTLNILNLLKCTQINLYLIQCSIVSVKEDDLFPASNGIFMILIHKEKSEGRH